MRISDWSSDVCSSDLCAHAAMRLLERDVGHEVSDGDTARCAPIGLRVRPLHILRQHRMRHRGRRPDDDRRAYADRLRSEEHTSELQSLMRISYAVFCLKKNTRSDHTRQN